MSSSRRLVVSPVAVATLVIALGWFGAAVTGLLMAHDTWGLVLTAAFALAGLGTLVLAGTLVLRLTEAGVSPLVGRRVGWDRIEAVAVRRWPGGLASLAVEVGRGRSVARRDLDVVGTAAWVAAVATELAARAGVEVTAESAEPPRSGGGRFAS
ncbi:hypothetical protein [Propionicicella superfundia]|uniref:hypothetical protein n=1 Tax=Propionicicella superfundia TaxID=348582 RepID=UPI000400C6E3|nr:hypothetical protein [Propionicicella superfundia]